jgi:hypothetical protein
MKNIRTEIHITVATFVGDDIGEAKPPLSRTADAVDAISLTRVSGLGSTITVSETVQGHILALMMNAAPVLAAKLEHATRDIPHL